MAYVSGVDRNIDERVEKNGINLGLMIRTKSLSLKTTYLMIDFKLFWLIKIT